MKTKKKYQGYTIEHNGDWFATKRGELVAGADTYKQLICIINDMVKQGVSHEADIERNTR